MDRSIAPWAVARRVMVARRNFMMIDCDEWNGCGWCGSRGYGSIDRLID